ncbi:MAG: non-canonical purine NTP pyrophosphatase [Acidobacteriaceae bacterium]
MTTIYIASTNPGKLRDFATAAAAHDLNIEPLPGLADIPAAPEDEPTFEGNARSKAIYYSLRAPGLVVLADDSGLEVDALHGAPGVRSARYAADTQNPAINPSLPIDERNNLRLLAELKSVPEAQRTGRYRCVLAAAQNGKILFTTQGFVEGRILTAPRGTGGFGYDPLFLLPQLQQTMAEIDIETKHSLSHRGLAFRKFLETWGARQQNRQL